MKIFFVLLISEALHKWQHHHIAIQYKTQTVIIYIVLYPLVTQFPITKVIVGNKQAMVTLYFIYQMNIGRFIGW